MVWFLVVLFGFLLVLQWSGFWVQETKSNFESLELERNGIMLMDSLVKNHDAEKPQYGAAVLDNQKKRVRSNVLERRLLQAIPAAQEKEKVPIFFQKLELVFQEGTSQKIFETEKRGKCLSLERLVVIENKKAVLRGMVCRE